MEEVVKIRMKKLAGKEGPIKLKVLPTTEVVFKDGIAEVPESVAKKLLGPGHPGAYEVVVERKIEEIPKKVEVQPVIKKQQKVATTKVVEEMPDETKEFAKQITG